MNTEPFVTSSINYSVDNGSPLEYYLYEPGPSVTVNRPGTDIREVCIYDAWSQADQCSVDREGFEILPFDGGFDDFDQDDAIKSRFYPQVITPYANECRRTLHNKPMCNVRRYS